MSESNQETIVKLLTESLLGKLAAAGAEADAEVIVLKRGDNADADIEAEMVKRGYKAVGDKCAGCKIHHEWEKDGKLTYVSAAEEVDGDDTSGGLMTEGEPGWGSEEHKAKQAKALASLDTRTAEVEKATEMLKELRASIAMPITERTPKTMLNEVMLAMRSRDLLGGA